jgi:hypothetical protein
MTFDPSKYKYRIDAKKNASVEKMSPINFFSGYFTKTLCTLLGSRESAEKSNKSFIV